MTSSGPGRVTKPANIAATFFRSSSASSYWSSSQSRTIAGATQGTPRIDLDLIGFDATELERLLALADGEAASDEAEDEVPEPPEDPVSRAGDLWVLGNHRVLCGDTTVLADVERVLGGQLADMCFADSPYNVDYANSPKDRLRANTGPRARVQAARGP